MIELTENDFAKLSEATNIPDYDLQKLYNMGLIKENVAIDFLIKYDFHKLNRRKIYRKIHIVTTLAEHYNVSKNKVFAAINNKRRKIHYCERCHRPVNGHQYKLNGGLCDRCVAKTIELTPNIL